MMPLSLMSMVRLLCAVHLMARVSLLETAHRGSDRPLLASHWVAGSRQPPEALPMVHLPQVLVLLVRIRSPRLEPALHLRVRILFAPEPLCHPPRLMREHLPPARPVAGSVAVEAHACRSVAAT